MNDLYDLYQELIIEHSAKPRNFGTLSQKTHGAKGHNPLCGDNISLELHIRNGHIEHIAFEGDGCAISKASASLMTESVQGLSNAAVETLFEQFHHMLVDTEAQEDINVLGKLMAFKGVRQFPVRVKCATLAWHTLKAALANSQQSISTE